MQTNQREMNAITQAFVAAGAKLPPVMQRVWNAVKEEPGVAHRDLCKRLSNIPPGSVSSTLFQMEQRGMVYSKGTKGYGFSGKAKAYYTDMAEYKLLPMPKKAKNGTTAPAEPKAALRMLPTGTNSEPRKTSSDDKFDLESLTIGEARALYAKLKAMFGNAL